MRVLEGLEPKEVFYFFEEICSIPHGSRAEKRLSDYIVHFAEKRGLFCRQDAANNVLVKKAGTKGYETAPTVILQGHIDMVCNKDSGIQHDFETDPIALQIRDGSIFAKGTTLGADNGIGAAYMLALLDSQEMPHPPLEMVFTTEEEIGMGGAKKFDTSDLEGKIFINLDTEEEGEFIVSCCGGNKTTVSLPIFWEDAPSGMVPYLLKLTGFQGGHSGSDIHLQRANANQLLGRILFAISSVYDSRVCQIKGGSQDNAIPREAEAVLLLQEKEVEGIGALVERWQKIIEREYQCVEEGISFTLLPMQEMVGQCFSKETAEKAVTILRLLPYGVLSMDMQLGNLVESSSNIGVVKTKETAITFENAIRSSVGSKKEEIVQKIKTIAALTGAETELRGEYPEWTFSKESAIVEKCVALYREEYGKEPRVTAIHAGLECGLFGQKIEGLDMISLGPDIKDAHTPREQADIASVARVWYFLQKVLCSITA